MSAERGQEPQKRKKKKKKLRNMVSNEAIPVPDWLPCVYVEKRQINHITQKLFLVYTSST